MSFDTATRNRLANFVGSCRKLLCGDFNTPGGEMAKLLAHYGIQSTGECFDVDSLTHLDEPGRETARTLRELLTHKQANAPKEKVWKKFDPAVYDLIQEQGFTILNRLCALRMAEERQLVFPCVSKGSQSDGFVLYEYHSGKGNTNITPEQRYQHFLFSVFDELSLDLGVLFDRFSPHGMLFPRPDALGELLGLIDDPALAPLWAEDETIGWIYQYWNSKEERKAMRDASAAPRNSRELAVRNQFFTPRYVVEFLTDNTLGRIWYEMTRGQTRLKDQCRYLVRRPNEIFLQEGEDAPEQPEQEGLSQEELLKQPVHIPHRPVKDPREIRLLDPACGSMHFGLYAFDLFEVIYEESWDNGLCPALQEAYSKKDDYLRDVPRLIIEHNIHGVDIDPRAVQIAGLSLWLRAQKSWKGTPAAERPRVRRSNIVCAEPMPGSDAMLEDFVATLDPPLLGELVKTVFDKMQLAGEAGTLLKIEEEIRAAIDEAKEKWEKVQRQQPELFSAEELNKVSDQQELTSLEQSVHALRSLGDGADFFETAEERIYAALRDYAESAEVGDYQRRLFAEDAAHGFAFIDLCRKRYDAVVMNPPFGESAQHSRQYLYSAYTNASQDIFSAFVDRGLNVLQKGGVVGAITSRLAFYLELLAPWRTNLYGAMGTLSAMADLGYGVLDDALVEAAAYVVQNTPTDHAICSFVNLLATEDKGAGLLNGCISFQKGQRNGTCFTVDPHSFTPVPASRAAYWASDFWRNKFSSKKNITNSYGFPFVGFQTGSDEFFLRLAWEPPPTETGGRAAQWVSFAKGGEYAQFFCDLHLLVNWKFRELARRTSNSDGYFQPGVTYTERTTSNLSARILPPDCVFSPNGVTIVSSESDVAECVAVLNTRASQFFIELCVGGGDAVFSGSAARHYGPRIVGRTPTPNLSEEDKESIERSSLRIWRLFQLQDAIAEPGRYFVSPFYELGPPEATVALHSEAVQCSWEDRILEILEEHYSIDRLVTSALGIRGEIEDEMIREMGVHPKELPSSTLQDKKALSDDYVRAADELIDLISQRMGTSRALTKKSFIADRHLELLSHYLGAQPRNVIECRRGAGVRSLDQVKGQGEGLLSYMAGVAFGRWDIRYATGERKQPELPDPFDPLPVCPPGMLQNADGLPATPADVPEGYPLRITWPGILVDDGGHTEDIVARVREALTIIWGERSVAIEQEACEILGVRTLRDYFAEKKSGGKFFKDHLSRYSKSRRQAPIYWPLSTESGTYTLWIYYHRLTEDTLYACITNFVAPKQEEVEKTLANLTAKGSARTAAEEKEYEKVATLIGELGTFRSELERLAKIWKPNLNDGVQITAAPLWRLFRLKPWQKKLKDTWSSLEKGDHDWAHLAHSLWPDRVIRKCCEDRSLAIAHGYEEDLWFEKVDVKGKSTWTPKANAEEISERLIAKVLK